MATTQVPKGAAIDQVLAVAELFELILQGFNYKGLFAILRVDRRFHHHILNTPQLRRKLYIEKNVYDTPNDWCLQVLNPLLNNTRESLRLSPTDSVYFRSSCVHSTENSSVFDVICDLHSSVMDGTRVGGLTMIGLYRPSWTKMRVASANVKIIVTTILGFEKQQKLVLDGVKTLGDVVDWLATQKRDTAPKLSAWDPLSRVSRSEELTAEQLPDTIRPSSLGPGAAFEEYADALKTQAMARELENIEKFNRRELERPYPRSTALSTAVGHRSSILEFSRPLVAEKLEDLQSLKAPSNAFGIGCRFSPTADVDWSEWERKYTLGELSDTLTPDS